MNFEPFSIQKVYSMFVYKMYTKFQMNFLAWWVYKKYTTCCIQNVYKFQTIFLLPAVYKKYTTFCIQNIYKIFKWVYGHASIQKIYINLHVVYKMYTKFQTISC